MPCAGTRKNGDRADGTEAVMLDKMLAGRVGTFHSSGSDVARNAEKLFGEYLEEKRRQDRL